MKNVMRILAVGCVLTLTACHYPWDKPHRTTAGFPHSATAVCKTAGGDGVSPFRVRQAEASNVEPYSCNALQQIEGFVDAARSNGEDTFTAGAVNAQRRGFDVQCSARDGLTTCRSAPRFNVTVYVQDRA